MYTGTQHLCVYPSLGCNATWSANCETRRKQHAMKHRKTAQCTVCPANYPTVPHRASPCHAMQQSNNTRRNAAAWFAQHYARWSPHLVLCNRRYEPELSFALACGAWSAAQDVQCCVLYGGLRGEGMATCFERATARLPHEDREGCADRGGWDSFRGRHTGLEMHRRHDMHTRSLQTSKDSVYDVPRFTVFNHSVPFAYHIGQTCPDTNAGTTWHVDKCDMSWRQVMTSQASWEPLESQVWASSPKHIAARVHATSRTRLPQGLLPPPWITLPPWETIMVLIREGEFVLASKSIVWIYPPTFSFRRSPSHTSITAPTMSLVWGRLQTA